MDGWLTWYQNLPTAEGWLVAIGSVALGLWLLFRLILPLAGLGGLFDGGEGPLDVDGLEAEGGEEGGGGGGFNPWHIVYFMLGFAWVAFVLKRYGGASLVLALVGGTLAGAATVALAIGLTLLLARTVRRVSTSGNVDFQAALLQQATVTIAVPANQAGQGKVKLVLEGKLVEHNALSEADAPLPRGATVVVTAVRPQAFVVAPLEA